VVYKFDSSHFSAYQDKDGIYQLVFHDHSPQAAIYWYEYLDTLYDITPAHHTLLFLVTFEGALPSYSMFNYYYKKLRQRHPVRCSSQSAILYRFGFFTRLLNAIVQIVPSENQTVIRVFPQWNKSSAIKWLLKEKVIDHPATSSA